MSWQDNNMAAEVQTGLLAQRRLDGDHGVFGSDDRGELQRLVSQGKQCEGLLHELGKLNWLKIAYERGNTQHDRQLLQPGTSLRWRTRMNKSGGKP